LDVIHHFPAEAEPASTDV